MVSPTHPRCRPIWLVGLCGVLAVATSHTVAQEQVPSTLDLLGAVELALNRHPSVRESRAREEAAGEGRAAARLAYVPHLDLMWQQNRATRANLFGMMLPQGGVPGISGPVLDGEELSPSSVWGSAGGLLMTWEIADFGQRAAGVDLASAGVAAALARGVLTQLDIAAAAADAFVVTLAADERVRAAMANVQRVEVFRQSVAILVENQLRPGADLARADAELAAARIQLIQAEQAAELGRIALAEALGIDGSVPPLDPGRLLDPAPPPAGTVPPPEQHPSARAQEAAIEVVRARETLAARSYLPQITFQSTVFARGSGATVDGVNRDGNGLLPQVSNWAAGLSVTFPLMDIFSATTRQRLEAANARAEEARYDETLQRLRAEEASAQALVRAAEQIAVQTPVQLQAARLAELQAAGRYNAGLGTMVEVADAQRVLAQAEADQALARLGIWRARLAEAHAGGDLTGFLSRVSP